MSYFSAIFGDTYRPTYQFYGYFHRLSLSNCFVDLACTLWVRFRPKEKLHTLETHNVIGIFIDTLLYHYKLWHKKWDCQHWV